MNQIPNSSQTSERIFLLFSLLTFNLKNNLTLNQVNYVKRVIKNPEKTDSPRLVLLLIKNKCY